MFHEFALATRFRSGSVEGFLHEPRTSSEKALVLTHGAGANCRAPLLIAAANVFATAGYRVLRYDLPFRQRRPFGPPHPHSAAEDRAGLRQAISAMRAHNNGPIFVGGHSYGGRQASILLAEKPGLCDGLLLLSYPLHPPKKPAELRTGHFPALQRPALFVHGTNDPFGSIIEMRAALELIPAATELVEIERAGHDLARGSFDIEKRVVERFEAIVARAVT